MLRLTIIFTMAAVMATAVCRTAPGQTGNGTTAIYPAVTHLVGHEDTALLNRVAELIGDWDPLKLTDPYSKTVSNADGARTVVRRSDLLEFIADAESARALGKALFWEIRAGSDFRRTSDGQFVGTACASCHYRFGTDARNRHNSRIPYVAWNKYPADPKYPLDQLSFDPRAKAAKDYVVGPTSEPETTIIGSAGVKRRKFLGFNSLQTGQTGPWESENSENDKPTDPNVQPPLPPHEWEMFGVPSGQQFRQISRRNSPSVYDAAFSDRLFHDGRAESTFNGFSIFGDRDERHVIHKRTQSGEIIPVRIAITHAALASQAVGPIVNDDEMSYSGRTFVDVARKLLDAPVLEHQDVAADDSVLGSLASQKKIGKAADTEGRLTYRQLIRRAFRREWWDGEDDRTVVLELTRKHKVKSPESNVQKGTIEEANFPLYWGLSLMLYQSGLISNESPFDAMMRGDGKPVNESWERHKAIVGEVHLDIHPLKPTTPPATGPLLESGTAVFQRGMRVFMNRDCVECHSGPFFSEVYDRLTPAEPGEPINLTMKNTLLPNSQGDAISLNYLQFHDETMDAVARILDPQEPAPRVKGKRKAIALDFLRLSARGSIVRMKSFLQKAGVPADKVDAVAKLLMDYEKLAPTKAGGRIFFGEPERIAAAERLVGPVLVESMRIPPILMPFRPRLPIAGAVAPNYAFYDFGFYNLGVSPPRFDRGNGGKLHDEPGDHKTNFVAESVDRPHGQANRMLRYWPKIRMVDTQALLDDDNPAPKPYQDRSWDRNDVDGDLRRSEMIFISRARQLVVDEETWGHRKPFLHDNELAFWGAFRTPSLRNVELTAPYMHNGRLITLRQVIDFYDKGGDVEFDREKNPDKHPSMVPLGLETEDENALLFFLLCLTDERVRLEKAPFDHPALPLVNGYDDATPPAIELPERIVQIPVVGSAGRPTQPSTFPAAD